MRRRRDTHGRQRSALARRGCLRRIAPDDQASAASLRRSPVPSSVKHRPPGPSAPQPARNESTSATAARRPLPHTNRASLADGSGRLRRSPPCVGGEVRVSSFGAARLREPGGATAADGPRASRDHGGAHRRGARRPASADPGASASRVSNCVTCGYMGRPYARGSCDEIGGPAGIDAGRARTQPAGPPWGSASRSSHSAARRALPASERRACGRSSRGSTERSWG